jgi:uncharacterized membrane protein YphA (DoxX/SURF4 family)
MSNDPNIRTTFIPLVLRLTLAAIFIYHGVSKVGDRHNEWGLTWASNMWQKRGEAPKAPLEELDKGIKRLQDDRAALEKKAEDLKKEGNAEKPENAERQAEIAGKLKDNETRQDDFRLAQVKIKNAYAASTTIPDALEYQGVQFAVAWGELVCGVAMLLGLLTRLAAAGLIVIMIGAIYTVTGPQGFSVAAGGYEYNLAILAMCVVLIIKGSGPLSVDGWLAARRQAAHHQQQQPVAV